MDHLSSTILMCAILLLFYASGTVKGVAVDEDCTIPNSGTDPCTTTNGDTLCSDASGTFKCACKPTHYKSGTNCIIRIALDTACTGTTITDQCITTNAMCRDDSGTAKCLCKTTHYRSGTACNDRIALDTACTGTTITDQCITTNAMCRDDSGTTKCLCKTTHYRSGTACNARKNPDATCEANQCVANAVCNTTDDKCDCNMGYIATPTSTPTSCEIVAFGDSCTIDSDCGEDNNVCSNSTCVCSDTSSRKGNACVISSDAATIMLAHMHVFIFGTVASLYFLL